MRAVLSIVFYILSGLFLGSLPIVLACDVIYEDGQFVGATLATVSLIYLALGGIPLLIGLLISWFRHGRRDVGIVLLSTAVYSLLLLVFFYSMIGELQYMKGFPAQTLRLFNLYHHFGSGAICVVIYALLGFAFYLCAKNKWNKPERNAEKAV
jgi:hypothetical protein